MARPSNSATDVPLPGRTIAARVPDGLAVADQLGLTLRGGRAAGSRSHTDEIVPGAKLRVCPELGHFSIVGEVLPERAALLRN